MNNEKRWRQRFENFEKSFQLFCRRQKEYKENPNNESHQMSLVQSYEISLELSWKTMKDYLENSGYNHLETPKKVIRQAFQAEVIHRAEEWMNALDKRNKTSHIYHPEILKEVLIFIDTIYFPIVRDLYYHLKKEFSSN